jgi:hypothetical protein
MDSRQGSQHNVKSPTVIFDAHASARPYRVSTKTRVTGEVTGPA